MEEILYKPYFLVHEMGAKDANFLLVGKNEIACQNIDVLEQ